MILLMALLSMMMMMMTIFLVFNGSGNTVQPGMFPGLDNWSDQGGEGRLFQSLAVLGKKEYI